MTEKGILTDDKQKRARQMLREISEKKTNILNNGASDVKEAMVARGNVAKMLS